METPRPQTLHYKRSNFATQLPVDCLYSPSHAWLARPSADRWRAGLTKFATRMLGEMVDHGFGVEPAARVEVGQIIGWVEGFKAISDLYCVVQGRFVGGNPLLKEQIEHVNRDPYGDGWLYEVEGTPDPKCMDVHAYRDFLDKTIDRLLARQQNSEHP
jgi:glycine cleavage system H protein